MRVFFVRLVSISFLLLGLYGLASSCGKSSEDSGDDKSGESSGDGDDDTVSAGTLAIADNGLAGAYPEGLSVNAFPEEIDPDPGTAAAGTVVVATLTQDQQQPANPPNGGQTGSDPEPFKDHPREKLKEDQKRLEGEGECFGNNAVSDMLFDEKNIEVCYGFDYGIVSGQAIGVVDQGKVNGAVDSAKTGSVTDVKNALKNIDGITLDTSGEVCIVANGRRLVSKYGARLDATLKFFQGILCQAKKDELDDLPAAGKSIDLTSSVNDALPSGSTGTSTIDAVKLERLDDNGDSPVFQTTIEMSNSSQNSEGIEEIVLVHSPSKDGNAAYSGTLTIKGSREEAGTGYTVATSLTYVKSKTSDGDIRMQFDVRGGDFKHMGDFTKTSSPFEDGRVKFPSTSSSAENDPVTNETYIVFDIDPSTYAGKVSFWKDPGGSTPRGYVAELTQDETSGKLSGCAWAGADRSNKGIGGRIAAGEAVTPTGCYTPQFSKSCNPTGVGGNQSDNVWKQCFAQNSDGDYIIDTAKTTSAEGYDVLAASAAGIPEIDIATIASPLE